MAATRMDPVLEVEGLCARYGNKPVLFGVDLEVRRGELVGLIGHNGAGKTTTLDTIFGVKGAQSGAVRFNAVDMLGRPTSRSVAAGMALARSERFVFAELTVRENLLLGGLYVRSAQRRQERLNYVHDLLPFLAERAGQLAGQFSGGQQRLLSIGMALMSDPTLILLDEPSLGVAPALTAEIFDTIKSLVDETGLSVLMVEQNIPQLLRVADRVYAIRSGRVFLEESAEQMRKRETYWDLF